MGLDSDVNKDFAVSHMGNLWGSKRSIGSGIPRSEVSILATWVFGGVSYPLRESVTFSKMETLTYMSPNETK